MFNFFKLKKKQLKKISPFPALILKLIPCLLLTIFMTLLVRMLIEARERRSRLCGGMGNGNSQAERTTAMLTGIVAIFLITELPQGVLTFAAGANPRLTFLTLQMNNVFDLLSLINSAVNFVLCALMSHVFRRFVQFLIEILIRRIIWIIFTNKGTAKNPKSHLFLIQF